MRHIFLSLLIILALTSTACSYPVEFVVINESDSPIELRFRIDTPPDDPDPITLIGPLAMTKASQLSARGWRLLTASEYKFDRKNLTVTVHMMPGEALMVKHCHDTAISLPLDKITITGADGEISLQGEQVFKAFVKETDTLFTLTYK